MKNFLLFLVVIVLALQLQGQDPNFSQTYNAPVLMNPAQTGNISTDWRLVGGYRSTAFTGMRSFATGLVSLEKSVATSLTGEDRFGIGGYAMFDESNGGALKSNNFGLSAAYNNRLDEKGVHTIGLGIQGVWTSSMLYVNKLVFEDQFSSGGFIPSVPSYEAYRGGNYSYLDFNAGINYELNLEKYGLMVGYSVFHINRPSQQFWGDDYRISVRNSVQLLGRIGIGQPGNNLHAMALFSQQGQFKETVVGGYYSMINSQETLRLNVGTLYRLHNSLIPMFGIEYNRFKGTITYDMNVDQSQSASVSRRALELFIGYGFGKSKSR